jgi:hypothetical protein
VGHSARIRPLESLVVQTRLEQRKGAGAGTVTTKYLNSSLSPRVGEMLMAA